MWDNRERKTNPKAPDFKCKDKANCDGVIWPPRGARQSGPAAPPSPYQQSAPKDPRGNGEDRSSRIERQHSQEMALRYLDLMPHLKKNSKPKDMTEMLREMTDWFQKDVGHVPTTDDKPTTSDVPYQQGNPDDDEIPF